ncbi:aldehyde dehydrogenase [Segetibacter sp. 3557_3]|nr:aldehyde dehydrogenase [Segetibacter sp. 3557_3]
MQDFFISGATLSLNFRKQQLKLLKSAVEKYEDRFFEALHADLHKSKEEAYLTEIGLVFSEIGHALKHLQNWMAPETVKTPIALFPSRSSMVRVPMGISLVIAPWNYPMQLLLAPLIGSIAAGNCTVLKPSELTPHTADVVTDMIREHFSSNYIAVVNGEGEQVVNRLMDEHRFDNVFFTGSTAVGKKLAMKAAEKLIPITLELGGKSPCIVDKDVDMDAAANRITWGKFTNAGQTCVAPDYLLVHESRKEELVNKMTKCIGEFYGTDPRLSDNYGRIVNERRFDALTPYLAQGRVITGGQTNREEKYIAPTIMDNVVHDQPLMKEEIFGPILPVFTFKEHEEAMSVINHNPSPLALYIFSKDKRVQQQYERLVQYGGGCINNTLVHLGNPYLPFGGTGNSGMGSYHGKFSFDCFTRPKAMVASANWPDPALKYPPYQGKLKLLRWLFS